MTIDAITWIRMVKALPLSKAEQEILRRFENDPDGRQFLPLSDVLRHHKFIDEALELLAQGVQNHPGFSVARVVYARELFQRGFLVDAWNALDIAPQQLIDNILAQKLRFKMAVLLGDEPSARQAYQLLRIQQGIDTEIRTIFERVESQGIAKARDDYRDEIKATGIAMILPAITPESNATDLNHNQKGNQRSDQIKTSESVIDDVTKRSVEKFRVMSLQELATSSVILNTSSDAVNNAAPSSTELDTTTLADIYIQQGLYHKALAIYKRMSTSAPHNDFLRIKINQASTLARGTAPDRHLADEVFDKMDVLSIIDRQMRMINRMLENLGPAE